jgi:hypothetical protein
MALLRIAVSAETTDAQQRSRRVGLSPRRFSLSPFRGPRLRESCVASGSIQLHLSKFQQIVHVNATYQALKLLRDGFSKLYNPFD